MLTDDEHVDIATDIVVATRIRAEHERVANACLALKDRSKLCDEPDGSRVKVAERRIHGVRGIHVPHSQRTDTPTLDESLPEELLKGQMYRPRTPVDPPNEFACMELLAGGTCQQREQAGLGPRALDIGHGWDDTSVSLADTDVSVGVNLPPRHARRLRPVMQPMNFAGNANQPCGSFKRMAYRTDGRAIHQQPAVRRTTTRTVTTHRVPRSHQREAAYEERPPQQESGLSAIRTA